jgi:hypothetical protein
MRTFFGTVYKQPNSPPKCNTGNIYFTNPYYTDLQILYWISEIDNHRRVFILALPARGEILSLPENSVPQTIVLRYQEIGGILVYETAKQWYFFYLKNI